jgi:hypothetical protein
MFCNKGIVGALLPVVKLSWLQLLHPPLSSQLLAFQVWLPKDRLLALCGLVAGLTTALLSSWNSL